MILKICFVTNLFGIRMNIFLQVSGMKIVDKIDMDLRRDILYD